LHECLLRNAGNDLLQQVHVFNEDLNELAGLISGPSFNGNGDKIRIIPHGRDLLFCDLFDYGNHNLPGRTVVVVNTDTFFD